MRNMPWTEDDYRKEDGYVAVVCVVTAVIVFALAVFGLLP
jgi:hypothetical protein